MGRTVYIIRKYCRRAISMVSPDDDILYYKHFLPPISERKFGIAEITNIDFEEWYIVWHHIPLLQGMFLLDIIIQNDGGFNNLLVPCGAILSILDFLKADESIIPNSTGNDRY